MTPRIGSLFSGYGGLDLAIADTIGGDVVWHADNAPAASAILARNYPGVPNLGDVELVDWSAVEPVDVLGAGFPCQDVSHVGRRRGLAPGTRSGLWTMVVSAIDALRPGSVVIENVRGLLSAEAASDLEPCPWCVGDDSTGALRALGAVLGDLAERGYDARWMCLRASDVGAPHERERCFVYASAVADPDVASLRHAATVLRRPQGQARHRGQTDDGPARGRARVSASRPTRAPVDDRIGALEAAGWGELAPSIELWEWVTGRCVPTLDDDWHTLPAIAEWMMGLPAGWVTDVGLSVARAMGALGNGVVPQQAAAAIEALS